MNDFEPIDIQFWKISHCTKIINRFFNLFILIIKTNTSNLIFTSNFSQIFYIILIEIAF